MTMHGAALGVVLVAAAALHCHDVDSMPAALRAAVLCLEQMKHYSSGSGCSSPASTSSDVSSESGVAIRNVDQTATHDTPSRPHVCPVCHKKFKRAFGLQMHTRVHTGEKPHQCDTCLKRFRCGLSMDIDHRKYC